MIYCREHSGLDMTVFRGQVKSVLDEYKAESSFLAGQAKKLLLLLCLPLGFYFVPGCSEDFLKTEK